MSPRVPEEAALDPWSEVTRLQEERASREAERQWEYRTERARTRWNIIWTVVTILALGAVVLGGFLTISRHMDTTRDRDLRFEEEFTEQVSECNKLPEPIERQYCLLALEPRDQTRSDEGGNGS